MAVQALLNVYAIGAEAFGTPKITGVTCSKIRKVNPVRDANNAWIGKCKPSNYAQINSEAWVEKDLSSDVDFYYENRTVTQVNTLINA